MEPRESTAGVPECIFEVLVEAQLDPRLAGGECAGVSERVWARLIACTDARHFAGIAGVTGVLVDTNGTGRGRDAPIFPLGNGSCVVASNLEILAAMERGFPLRHRIFYDVAGRAYVIHPHLEYQRTPEADRPSLAAPGLHLVR